MARLSFDKADHLREFLFTILESLPGGVLLADRHGLLLAANQKALQLMGLAGSSVQNRSCWELLQQAIHADEDDIAPLKKANGKLLFEVRQTRDGGEGRYWLIARNELQSPFLSTSGFFLSMEDVTYPSMVEAQVERNKRFNAMQEMAVAMSQELKNPLGSLELYASLLHRECAGDHANQRLAGQMLHAVHSMNHLLDNFMTFSSLPQPERETIAVEPWLEGALGKMHLFGEEYGVEFDARYSHKGDEIVGDPELLDQLILNLGINAVEAMPKGGEVKIVTRSVAATREHAAFLEIQFIDTGEGIAKADINKIFDPFFTSRGRGKGLGLAIAHHITEVHQGFIRVESKAGKGSTFVVLLPYKV